MFNLGRACAGDDNSLVSVGKNWLKGIGTWGPASLCDPRAGSAGLPFSWCGRCK